MVLVTSRSFWALATIVHFGAVVGVVVPVGIAVLTGTPLFGRTDRAPGEVTFPAPPASVAPPLSAAGGPGSGFGVTTESTPRATPGPTPTPAPTPTATPTPTPPPAATPDARRPTITGRNPGPNAVAVAGNSTIRILFSEPVLNASGATIQLFNAPGGWLVRSTVRYDAASRTATLTPNLEMYPRTEYRITISSGITDRAGNRLAPTAWTFQVGSR